MHPLSSDRKMKLSKFMKSKQKVKKEKLEDLPSIPKELLATATAFKDIEVEKGHRCTLDSLNTSEESFLSEKCD